MMTFAEIYLLVIPVVIFVIFGLGGLWLGRRP